VIVTRDDAAVESAGVIDVLGQFVAGEHPAHGQSHLPRALLGRPDPVSGQPELKATPASVEAVAYRSRGYLLTRDAQADKAISREPSWVAKSRPEPPETVARAHHQPAGAAWASRVSSGLYRCVVTRDDHLVAALSVAPGDRRPDWELAKGVFAAPDIEAIDRRALQAAPTASTEPAPAAMVAVMTSSPTPWQAQTTGPAEAVAARPESRVRPPRPSPPGPARSRRWARPARRERIAAHASPRSASCCRRRLRAAPHRGTFPFSVPLPPSS
jgi:hypothetical protein